MAQPLSRRRFVVGAVSSTVLACTWTAGCEDDGPKRADEQAAPALDTKLLVDLGALLPTAGVIAGAAGRAGASQAAAVEGFLAGLSVRSGPGLLTEIATAVRADYRAGRTGTVEGWRLSHTELGLCALLASAPREPAAKPADP